MSLNLYDARSPVEESLMGKHSPTPRSGHAGAVGQIFPARALERGNYLIDHRLNSFDAGIARNF